MKLNKYITIIFCSCSSLITAQENSVVLEDVLSSIKGANTTKTSRLIGQCKIQTRKDYRSLVAHTRLTKNSDLVKFIENRVKTIDWTIPMGKRTRLMGEREDLEVLAELKSPLIKEYKSYFLKSVDFDYAKYKAWTGAHIHKGNQGGLARATAKYSPELFKEFIALIDDPKISVSKKITIIWAMRFDHSGMSEKALVEFLKKEWPKDLKWGLKASLAQVRADIMYNKDIVLNELVKAKKLKGLSIEVLEQKIGKADEINEGVYFYKIRDGQTGDDVTWELSTENKKVSGYIKYDPTKQRIEP